MQTELKEWEIYFDEDRKENPGELGPGDIGDAIRVPSVWLEKRPDYDGVAWYRIELKVSDEECSEHIRMCFDAVHYACIVFCNGERVDAHEGGYTPFKVVLDRHLRVGRNEIMVRVLGPARDREIEGFRVGSPINQSNIPTWKAGWYVAFGGIWQPVYWERTPRVFADSVKIRPLINPKSAEVVVAIANLTAAAEEVSVEWEVSPWRKDGEQESTITRGRFVAALKAGEKGASSKFVVDLAEAQLWDLDQPNLYELHLRVISRRGVHATSERFGLRSFTTDGAFFYLNGKRIILRGTLHQGLYPKRVAAPHDESMARRDLELLKQAQCNFVRLHIKPAPKRTLELADEMGILCMEEPPIGWITYDEEVVSRAVHNVREMVRRDHNHPSLVMWCLFNELNDSVYTNTETASSLIIPCYRAAREMDDTRLIIDASGTPRGDAPDEDFGIRVPQSDEALPIVDVHPYQRIPIKSNCFEGVRSMASDEPGLLFFSEFGTSGFPDMTQLLRQYSAEDQALNLRDYRQLKNYSDRLREGYEQFGLKAHFETLGQFYQALQADHCESTDSVQRALRENDRCAGYVITQHADAGSEFGGITDLWRQPKRVFNIFRDCNADRLLTVRVEEPSVRVGGRLEVNVAFTDFTPEPVSLSGLVTVRREDSILERQTFSASGDRVLLCWSDCLEFSDTGSYTIEAEVSVDGVAYSHQARVEVFPLTTELAQGDLYVAELAGDSPGLEDRLQELGYRTLVFRNQHNDPRIPVVVRLRNRDLIQWRVELQRVLRGFVEQGGQVIIVDSELAHMHHFFGHSFREFYGVGAYAGNVGFALDRERFALSGEWGHLGEPYAYGYPRVHTYMEDVVAHGYQPLAFHVVPYQFGHPDEVYFGCSCFSGKIGKGEFTCLQFHPHEFIPRSPVMTNDFLRMVERARAAVSPQEDPVDPVALASV
ncbi:MAG: glycoside hydrolase family 2 protein [Puniceicoccales bacterium]